MNERMVNFHYITIAYAWYLYSVNTPYTSTFNINIESIDHFTIDSIERLTYLIINQGC